MRQRNDIRKGDKVVVLRGDYQGQRGIIDDVQENIVKVIFPESTAEISIDILQNFSAAARKAWQTRPTRGVGRPKDPDLSPKHMVSLRLEVEVWDDLGRAVEAGLIRSREAAVNQWLRKKLDELWLKNAEDKNFNG